VTPEFSRTVDADTVSESPRQMRIEADETERRRLAGRFALKAVERLSADVRLARRAGIIHAEGAVDADVVQSCVVTDEPLPAHIDAPFSVRFVPDAYVVSPDEELELSAEDCDTLPLEGGRIDLGELAAETLALALDPFPRSASADTALEEAGLGNEADAGPFAALRALKEQMQKKG
jgi:uncharacterized metal-binding protein YceD (DUF177 family)